MKPVRSLLFVPGDSERKQARALESPADALIFDLEDSVDPARLAQGRAQVAAVLGAPSPRAQRWVRVNGPASGLLLPDLAAVMAAARPPDGIVLPKISSPAEVIEVAHYLSALETVRGLPPGTTRLIVIATETPQGLLALPQYAQVLGPVPAVRARLAGLTWGMEDLGTALGARERRDSGGALTFPFQLARASCLLTSASLRVAAIDSVQARFKDREGLLAELAAAVRDGFTGKLAIHPDQVEPINAAFTPKPAQIAQAREVVAAFAAAGTGVVSLNGQMLDRPHLLAAQRVLASSGDEPPPPDVTAAPSLVGSGAPAAS